MIFGSFYAVGMPVAVVLAYLGGYDFKGLWLGLFAAQTSCVLLMSSDLRLTVPVLPAEPAPAPANGRGGAGTSNDEGWENYVSAGPAADTKHKEDLKRSSLESPVQKKAMRAKLQIVLESK